MAGTNAGFDAASFRDGIRMAMGMGAPVGDLIRFYFTHPDTTETPVDDTGTPFDPAQRPTHSPDTYVTVSCAVEHAGDIGEHERFGYVAAGTLRVLLLDADFALVDGCSYCVYGGDRYDFRKEEPPMGLFDVGIHTLIFVARGER